MDDSFQMPDPQSAQRFLRSFGHPVQIRGESCFRGGRVHDLRAEMPGEIYSALVQDRQELKVYLEYDPFDGWAGQCTCEAGAECEHIFAVMRALLVEHGAAMVRNLSSSRLSRRDPLAPAQNRKGSPGNESLSARLSTALTRPLSLAETDYVRKVTQTFERCRNTRHITNWDFLEMELGLGGNGWEGLEIWPAFPQNEYEFWLYVALAARERGVAVPDFMQCISDVTEIQRRVDRWRRGREIEKWNKVLGRLALYSSPRTSSPPAQSRLRVVIEQKEARLQWQGPLQKGFETIKPNQLGQFANDYARGQLELDLESELIWQTFSRRQYGNNDDRLRYTDPEAARILGRLFRLRPLENQMVGLDGQPIARPAEPLRWSLTPAATPEDDYRLNLVQSDGAPHPPILCVLPGRPTLYLTASSVYRGPPENECGLNTDIENRIPAPAMERPAGVSFLQNLELEMPPRLRERVRTLSYQLRIRCELRPIHLGSKTEDCHFSVVASAADGHEQTWTGNNWLDTTARHGRHPATRQEQAIICYDQSSLERVPTLLAPLALRPTGTSWTLALRVNKKFPELFSSWLKTVPPDIALELAGDLASFGEADISGRVKLEVSEAAIDWFDLRVVLDVSDTTLTAAELKLLLNARGAYVRLAGKGWRRLSYELSEDENERLARLGLSPRELSAEPQRLHALQLADEAAKKFLPEHQVAQIQRRAGEIKERVTPALPLGVTAQLRPYQLEGFHFLAYLAANHFGGILADDMGLGKTLQTLAWLMWLRQSRLDGTPPGPSLVVCPKSVMDNWHAEAARFTPSLRVKLWAASDLPSFAPSLADADLHVLNYSQLRLMGETLSPVTWLAIILDEGQYIKNPNSQTAQVARSLHAENRLILSGTPIENRLLDLWSLMAFAMPGVLSSRAEFARLYDAKGDPLARRRLASRVRPFLLRRTKSQVAKDLPDRIEEDLFCEVEGEQLMLYRAELKRAQQLLLQVKTQQELAEHQFHFLTSLLRLRQICCHPGLLNAQSTAPSAKFGALFDLLEPLMEEGQKVLVFSQFTQLLTLLKPAFLEREWPMFYLDGETENRGELVQKFQATEGPAVFLISLKAGGFGLNLTAASYVVLFDPWWNPAVENQAIDRTHRIGQVNKVIAYRLLIKSSIEEKIRELQRQKKALAQDVFGEERFAQGLTLQDLHFLFAD